MLELAVLVLSLAPTSLAQGPQRDRRPGGFVPGQERPTGDPELIARGKQSYEINCRGCHGADLRGGDMGGPNLLRSQIALSDRDGEHIVPVIQGSLAGSGMPAITMPPEAAKATAAYVRSVLATIGVQGKPPSSTEPPTIVVGNAGEGQAYFAAKCASCHSATGDLKGIASRLSDPKVLQNAWVAGRAQTRRFGGGGGAGGRTDSKPVTVTVRQPSGESVEGNLLRIDDFLVTLQLPDGSSRTFRRDGSVPTVEVHDPLEAHHKLMTVLSDKDMHDVTAYLVTLK
jgi:cytochrome c oxidase cbb3-type subunit 3